MHHRLDAVGHQQVVHVIDVPQVADHERGRRHGRPVAHAQVVEHRDGVPAGYWEWFRLDGTIMRSGTFEDGEQVGDWTTYDKNGKVYKVTTMKEKAR